MSILVPCWVLLLPQINYLAYKHFFNRIQTMAYYFGFEPSDDLKNNISAMRAAVEAKDAKLFEHRDVVVKKMVNELIDILLTQLVHTLPEGNEKKTMLKVSDIVQSTSTKLMGQILGKDDVADVMPTIDFFENKTAKVDANGVERLGFELTSALHEKMHSMFSEAIQNGTADGRALNAVFDEFTDAVVQHFLSDFADTLKLGFVKRKLLPVADSAIKKGVKMGNKQLFPQLNDEDKVDVCTIYSDLMFTV